MSSTCYICQRQDAQIDQSLDGTHIYDVSCSQCGKYRITYTATAAEMDLSRYGPRWKLSAAVRTRYENGERLELSVGNLSSLIDSMVFPQDPLDYIDRLLEYIYKKTGKVGSSIELKDTDFPAICAENYEQFLYITEKARDLSFLEKHGKDDRLSIKGWQRVSDLRQKNEASNRAFVAMWFDKEMNTAWQDGIEPALEESGYRPIRLDFEEYNEKICDKIIAEIRNAGLLVADFTGQRGGVYFEAGFALGLGIPVIWTCRKDSKDDIHFDTSQYNHIIWEAPEELKQKLMDRIAATGLFPKQARL